MHSDPVYRCRISQKISVDMVLSLRRKCRYGIPFQIVPLPALQNKTRTVK